MTSLLPFPPWRLACGPLPAAGIPLLFLVTWMLTFAVGLVVALLLCLLAFMGLVWCITLLILLPLGGRFAWTISFAMQLCSSIVWLFGARLRMTLAPGRLLRCALTFGMLCLWTIALCSMSCCFVGPPRPTAVLVVPQLSWSGLAKCASRIPGYCNTTFTDSWIWPLVRALLNRWASWPSVRNPALLGCLPSGFGIPLPCSTCVGPDLFAVIPPVAATCLSPFISGENGRSMLGASTWWTARPVVIGLHVGLFNVAPLLLLLLLPKGSFASLVCGIALSLMFGNTLLLVLPRRLNLLCLLTACVSLNPISPRKRLVELLPAWKWVPLLACLKWVSNCFVAWLPCRLALWRLRSCWIPSFTAPRLPTSSLLRAGSFSFPKPCGLKMPKAFGPLFAVKSSPSLLPGWQQTGLCSAGLSLLVALDRFLGRACQMPSTLLSMLLKPLPVLLMVPFSFSWIWPKRLIRFLWMLSLLSSRNAGTLPPGSVLVCCDGYFCIPASAFNCLTSSGGVPRVVAPSKGGVTVRPCLPALLLPVFRTSLLLGLCVVNVRLLLPAFFVFGVFGSSMIHCYSFKHVPKLFVSFRKSLRFWPPWASRSMFPSPASLALLCPLSLCLAASLRFVLFSLPRTWVCPCGWMKMMNSWLIDCVAVPLLPFSQTACCLPIVVPPEVIKFVCLGCLLRPLFVGPCVSSPSNKGLSTVFVFIASPC